MDRPKFYFTNVFNQFKPLLLEYSMGRKRFPKGSTMFSSAQTLDFCFYIESGLARYSVMHESGAEKTLFYHGAGSMFPAYSSPRQYRINEFGFSISEIEGFVISQKRIKELMTQNVALMKKILDTYLEMFNFLVFDSINQCYSSAYVRLCNFLYIYMEDRNSTGEDGLEIRLTQEELASIVAVSRVQISAILNRLRNQKIIQTDRKRICIRNIELLAEQCTGEAYIE